MLIGISDYDSDTYHNLPAVRADLHYMQAVLQSTEIGQYNDCDVVADPTRAEMLYAIESFLEERQQSESALLYFSGHGEFCEADNQLYFLTRDSDPADLPRTAVSAEFLERTLQSCRAASKIVLLDCCASGSVVQGWRAKGRESSSRARRSPVLCCAPPASTSSPLRTRCRPPPPWPPRDRRSAPRGSPVKSSKDCGTGGSRTAVGYRRRTSSST